MQDFFQNVISKKVKTVNWFGRARQSVVNLMEKLYGTYFSSTFKLQQEFSANVQFQRRT